MLKIYGNLIKFLKQKKEEIKFSKIKSILRFFQYYRNI